MELLGLPGFYILVLSLMETVETLWLNVPLFLIVLCPSTISFSSKRNMFLGFVECSSSFKVN